MTTTVKAKFRPSTVKDRPGTIVYLVTHRRIARQITTSYKVFPREWDEKCSEPIAAGNDRRAAIVQSNPEVTFGHGTIVGNHRTVREPKP